MSRLLYGCLVWYCVGMMACCEPEQMCNVKLIGRDSVISSFGWDVTTQLLAMQFGVQKNKVDKAIHSFDSNGNSYLKGGLKTAYYPTQQIGSPMFDAVNLTYTKDSLGLTWNEILQQIYCEKKPLVYSYGKPGAIGHLLIIIGYTNIGGTHYLRVLDPEQPLKRAERYISYEEYYEPVGRDTRWSTWYNFERKLE